MKKTLYPLVAAADAAAIEPIIAALREKGFRIAGESGRDAAVLLVLSKAFASDEALQERFFALESAGREIIPVDLDGAPQPELVKAALIAKNAIAAQGRTPEEIAARVASAEIFQSGGVSPKLSRILIAAAAVLILGAGVWIWRSNTPEEPEPTPEPTEEVVLPELDRFGLSAADLEQIGSMVIIGDRVYPYTIAEYRANYYYPEWGNYASQSWDGGVQRFYSFEDGSEIPVTRYDDLGVLALMPRLTRLTLINVESEKLPSLAALQALDSVQVYNCRLDDCEWLAGSSVTSVAIGTSGITDFSPLSACKKLSALSLSLSDGEDYDFSGFAPSAMRYFSLWSGYGIRLDLSAMRACKSLRTVELFNLSARDLDFLSGSDLIAELTISGLHELRDVSALGRMKSLQKLNIYDCPALSDISALSGLTGLSELDINSDAIRDFSPIGGCRGLLSVFISSSNLHDASFLSGLPALTDVHLFVDTLQNVDFLATLNAPRGLSATFNGDVLDYSGLAAIKKYDYISLGPNRPTLERALVYLQEADIRELSLTNVKAEDWELIPLPMARLWIHDSDLRDLSGFPAWNLGRCSLEFTDLPHLRSLQGIEAALGLDSGMPAITIRNCPLLSELALPKHTHLRQLTIADTLIAPSLRGLSLNALRLENIVELEDLECLFGLDTGRRCNFELVGLEKLSDLSMLKNFRGDMLTVPPHLAEQAEELVEKGRFQRWDVAYPEGGWQPNDVEVVLESLSELQSMPKALLRHVKRLTLAGDRLMGPDEEYWSYENRDNRGKVIPMLHLSDGDVPMAQGTLTDLSSLADLTGLEELVLWDQPLTSIDGIQTFTALRHLEIKWCGELRDVSPAFALQGLDNLCLSGLPISSIQGVQNLQELIRLDISYTDVTDLSPLAEGSYDRAAREWGGLSLCLEGLKIADYSPLGAVGQFYSLNFDSEEDSTLWADALGGSQVEELLFFHSSFDSESFARFARQHPELRVLWMPWNEGIDDLTVLLELPELRTVDISFSMEEAVRSLEGKDFGFELIVEQPN